MTRHPAAIASTSDQDVQLRAFEREAKTQRASHRLR